MPLHNGKCARLHGHSWIAAVEVEGATLIEDGAKSGMVLDYGDLSALVRPLVAVYLDHHYLNETTGLINPTSEELARWIYLRLTGIVPGLTAVTVYETCTSECRYAPAGH